MQLLCAAAQESRVVRVIKKQLVKRSLDMIKDIAARPEKDGKNDYETFWDSFGKFIKLGAIEDQSSTCAPLSVSCHASVEAGTLSLCCAVMDMQ